ESWTFDAVSASGPTRRLVLRRDPPGHHVQTSRRDEFLLLRVAAAAGVCVPRVHWCEDDPATLGAPFFVMEFVAGETLRPPPRPASLARGGVRRGARRAAGPAGGRAGARPCDRAVVRPLPRAPRHRRIARRRRARALRADISRHHPRPAPGARARVPLARGTP